MFRFFESRIDPFRAHDESMPPANLIAFYWRYCKQVRVFLACLLAIGLIVALIEVSIVRFVGALVDMLRATSPDRVLHDYGATFLWLGLVILIARPLANLAHDLLTQQTLAPGMTNLIRWQTHHFVLRQSLNYFANDFERLTQHEMMSLTTDHFVFRQSLNYFANDFAGRVASNVVQTGPSLRESVVQIIDALWFVAIDA